MEEKQDEQIKKTDTVSILFRVTEFSPQIDIKCALVKDAECPAPPTPGGLSWTLHFRPPGFLCALGRLRVSDLNQ